MQQEWDCLLSEFDACDVQLLEHRFGNALAEKLFHSEQNSLYPDREGIIKDVKAAWVAVRFKGGDSTL